MNKFGLSVSSAIQSMAHNNVAHNNVVWHSETSYEFTAEEKTEQDQLVENAVYGTGHSSYLEYVAKILGCCRDHSPAIKLPKIAANRHSIIRSKRVARSARPAVRQTFAARKAAKTADSGGGSSDPDGRRPQTESNASKTRFTVSAFLSGGAK